MQFLKSILGILLSVFAPIILIAAGSGIVSLGLNYSFNVITGAGVIMIAVGFLWGLVIYFYYDGGF